MLSRDVLLDNRERRVDHHIYRFVAGPIAVSISFMKYRQNKESTLYPAAYPRPGKREVNFRPAEAVAYSLKMT